MSVPKHNIMRMLNEFAELLVEYQPTLKLDPLTDELSVQMAFTETEYGKLLGLIDAVQSVIKLSGDLEIPPRPFYTYMQGLNHTLYTLQTHADFINDRFVKTASSRAPRAPTSK